MFTALNRIIFLGYKELKSFLMDIALVLFVFYAFTLNILIAAEGVSLELKRASIAIVDEDHSTLSKRFFDLFREPYFRPPVALDRQQIDGVLDQGKHVFVLDVPTHFSADLLSGKPTALQLNIDATAVSQAYVGAGYIQQILGKEIRTFFTRTSRMPADPVKIRTRVKYNPNRNNAWFQGLTNLLMTLTMLSMLLPGTALIREKEHGTIEHLLVMPLRPIEIMFSKIWTNALVVLLGTAITVFVILKGLLHCPIEGSLALFFLGTSVFQITATGLGILIATFAKNIPHLSLFSVLVLMPMVFLSGAWTPPESMHPIVQSLMFLSPLKYYVDFSLNLFFRGAGLNVLWPDLLSMIAIGLVCFIVALTRFRKQFSASMS